MIEILALKSDLMEYDYCTSTDRPLKEAQLFPQFPMERSGQVNILSANDFVRQHILPPQPTLDKKVVQISESFVLFFGTAFLCVTFAVLELPV